MTTLTLVRARLIAQVLLIFSILVALFFLGRAEAATPPMQWSRAATYFGPSSNSVTLSWSDLNEPLASRYELRAYWLERPSKSPLIWKLAPADVIRVGTRVSKLIKAPGAGTFTFEVRSCFEGVPAEVCTAWSSSINPEVAGVQGSPGAWRIYFYLEPPGSVVPIPSTSSTPTGPER